LCLEKCFDLLLIIENDLLKKKMKNDLFKKNEKWKMIYLKKNGRKMETLNLYFFRYMKIRLENDLFNHFKIDLIRWI